jgi:EmrB/QacA subfamily drug resistance transporter
MTSEEHAPARMRAPELALKSRAGHWVLAVAVLGSGMAFLDGTVVNVALPTIGRDLNASTSSLQWILNGYQLTLASLILLGGSLGDRYGRRRVFTIGVVLFTAASVLCAAAPTVEILILARVVQGVGGALLTPGSLAMIEASMRESDRPRAIGAWSGLTGVATAIGPLLGGFLVTAVSWRAVFLINVPFAALVVAFVHHVPETRDPMAHGRIDVAGAVLGALALAASTIALVDAGRGLSPSVIVFGTVGIASLLAFIVCEARSPNPMMPLGMFASRQFSAANLVTFVTYAAIGGFFFLVVAFLQISLGYSPTAAGAATLPVTLLMLGFSARSGELAQRIGPRIPLTVGPLVIAAGLLLLTRISPGDSYVTGVLPGVVVFGLGLTLVASPVTATVLAAADARHAGIASGINNSVARVAQLLAVAVLPLVADLGGDRFYEPAAMTHGFHVAMAVSAAVAAAGGVLAWFGISDDALSAGRERRGEAPVAVPANHACALAGPPAIARAASADGGAEAHPSAA